MVMAIAQSVVECRVHIAETNRGGRYYYVYVVQCHTSRKPESPTMPADSTWPCVTTVTPLPATFLYCNPEYTDVHGKRVGHDQVRSVDVVKLPCPCATRASLRVELGKAPRALASPLC